MASPYDVGTGCADPLMKQRKEKKAMMALYIVILQKKHLLTFETLPVYILILRYC